MKALTRYVIKTVLQTTLIVVIALMSMDFFIQLINEFNDIGTGNYTITHAMFYVLLGLPRDLYQLFPIAGLIGCLLGLGLLASHSELVVMRAAGMSVLQISISVIYAIIFMVFIVSVFGEVISPSAVHMGDTMRAEDKSGGQAVATGHGIWLRDGPSFIHINTVKSSSHLKGISKYLFNDKHQLINVAYAKYADYSHRNWLVKDIYETEFHNSKIKTKQIKDAVWHMQINPTILKMAEIEPYEMTMPKLYKYIKYQKKNNLQYEASALNFWQRVFQPLGTCVMLFLAIPFIFGPLRTVTMGLRLVSGVVVGFSFYMLNQFFGPFSLVYHVPPFLAALTPSLLFAMVAFIFMRRVK